MTVEEAVRVLKLTLPASAKEVQEAYRLRAQLIHPDKVGDNPKLRALAEAEMRELNEAYALCGSGKKAVRLVVRQASAAAPTVDSVDYDSQEDEEQEAYTPPPTPPPAKRGPTVGAIGACVFFGPICMFAWLQNRDVASVVLSLIVCVPCTVYLSMWLFGFLGRRGSIAVGMAASAVIGVIGATTGNRDDAQSTEANAPPARTEPEPTPFDRYLELHKNDNAVPVIENGGLRWVIPPPEQPKSACEILSDQLQAAGTASRKRQLLKAYREQCSGIPPNRLTTAREQQPRPSGSEVVVNLEDGQRLLRKYQPNNLMTAEDAAQIERICPDSVYRAAEQGRQVVNTDGLPLYEVRTVARFNPSVACLTSWGLE